MRGSTDELEAAAALCRSVGYWAAPVPVAERLARPSDLDVDGLLVVADVRPSGAVVGTDLRWAAVHLDGHRSLVTGATSVGGPASQGSSPTSSSTAIAGRRSGRHRDRPRPRPGPSLLDAARHDRSGRRASPAGTCPTASSSARSSPSNTWLCPVARLGACCLARRLAELLAVEHVAAGELDRPVEHAEQRPARQHEAEGEVGRTSAGSSPSIGSSSRSATRDDFRGAGWPTQPVTRLRRPSRCTAAHRRSVPTIGAAGRTSATTTSPSTSRSVGRASRSATGSGAAQ